MNEIKIIITMTNLAGFAFERDGERVQWHELTRAEQSRALRSLESCYNLYYQFLKDEDDEA